MPVMPSNLVGVRLVCNSTVLRDWALHFGPSGGGTLVDFFADIATGKNDAGDGFVLDPKYDAAKVQARVADQKDGKEMTLPASASFQDATNFGQWFTFQVPLRAGFKSGETKPRPAATAAAHQQRSSSWLTAAMVNQSVPAAASERSVIPTTVSMRGSPVVHSELNSDTPTGASSAVLNVPPLNVGLINDAHSMHNVLKVGTQDTADTSTSNESVTSSDSDLECNTHQTTNLDEEEEQYAESPTVDSSQDALSCVHESFVQLMHKLLKAMPSTPQSARLLQCANPPYTPTGRKRDENGDHNTMPVGCDPCGIDDAGAWTYNISQLVFDYITTVMFDEGIMLDLDYSAWEGVLLVVEHNPTACKVALAKLGDHPEIAGKCLMAEAPGPCKDFAYLFCKAVIRHSHITHHLVIKDVEASPVYKLGAGLLEVFGVCEDCTKVDVIPLFDVVCSCVLVTLQLGYKALWSSSVLALSKVSSTLAEKVWGGHAVQVLKLETINKIFARLVREGMAINNKPLNGPPYELPAHLREEFRQQSSLAKGFVHPLMLVKDEFVEFIQAYIWGCDTTTFQVLVALEELLSDENSFAGHDFEQVAQSIRKIVGINDRFQTHRMVYWLFRPEESKAGIWHMAFGRFGRQHRWRLLHLLMKLSDCGEETMQNFQSMPNWGRLLGWMQKDGAIEGGKVLGDSGIDKGVVYRWACQFGEPKESGKQPLIVGAGSSTQKSSQRHSRHPSIDT